MGLDSFKAFGHNLSHKCQSYSDKLGFYHLAVESKNKLATICYQTGPNLLMKSGDVSNFLIM